MASSKNHDGEGHGRRKAHRALPLLPLRDIVVFPYMVVPLFVGREKSIQALEQAMARDKEIVLCAQRKSKTNDPAAEDIYTTGTLGEVIQMLRLPDGAVKVLVEGKRRVRLRKFTHSEDFLQVEVDELAQPEERGAEVAALIEKVQAAFETYVKLSRRIPQEMIGSTESIDDPARLSDTLVAQLTLKLTDKQQILELESPSARLQKLLELMQAEMEILQVEKKIRTRVKKQMARSQKELYLNEQMQAIQKELGERDEFKNEIQELEDKIRTKRMSREAQLKLRKELKKLKMMSPMSAEATVVRNYIDWVLSLPWEERTQDKLNITEAEHILDEDHYGLQKIKERIVEYLAVQALVKKLKGPILCLVGPPGVGKTSLAKSIARATGRRFVRLSLGGVRDEAEIRGHRRTYIGAMPGKIIQSLKKAGSNNPVMLLDEVDKMSTDFRGDPSAALLEVLDPEQNSAFVDHYLDVDYDLSDVMFVATANSLHSIPMPLQDRMEIIHLPGYTEWEKLAIAQQYLIPKEREMNGIGKVALDVSADTIRSIIHHYTKEAGVRSLEREISTICRKLARETVVKTSGGKTTEQIRFRITGQNLPKYLGEPKYRSGKMGEGRGRAVQRPGGDHARRRAPGHRGERGAGQGQAGAHRQARRGDAGVGAGGDELRALAGRCAGPGARLLPEGRSTCALPRRGGAQGRAVGGHHHGHQPGLGALAAGGAARRGDDRRGDAARPGAADRGPQGQDPRRPPRRHLYLHHPVRESEGPKRHPAAGDARDEDHRRRSHGSGAAQRAGARPPRDLPQPAEPAGRLAGRRRQRSGARPVVRAGRGELSRRGSSRGVGFGPTRGRLRCAPRGQ